MAPRKRPVMEQVGNDTLVKDTKLNTCKHWWDKSIEDDMHRKGLRPLVNRLLALTPEQRAKTLKRYAEAVAEDDGGK